MQADLRAEHRLPQAAHRDSGQQTLWHVGYNDTDEKDDGLEPGVLKDQRKNEEGHTQEHSHTRDDVDKMFDFGSDGCLATFQPRRECRDSSHHRAIPSVHDDAACGAFNERGRVSYTAPYQRSHRICAIPGVVKRRDRATHVLKGEPFSGAYAVS